MKILNPLMSKGKALTDYEKDQITAYYDTIKNFREIARRINRGPDVVRNFLKNKENYGTAKRSGRLSVLSERVVRQVQKKASNSTLSVRKINSELNTGASDSTLLRAIHSNRTLSIKNETFSNADRKA